jgi:hypothetical protein
VETLRAEAAQELNYRALQLEQLSGVHAELMSLTLSFVENDIPIEKRREKFADF